MQSVTIHDVAEQAGVSIKTVSRVLNREPNVRPETRDRVVAAVQSLRYRPNVSARSLAGSRSYLIGLLFDNPSTAYISDLQLGAIARCREAGYHLLVEPVDSTEPGVASRVEEMLAVLKLDGLILTPPVCDHPAVLEVLDKAGAPYVRIAADRQPGRAARVAMDDRQAAYQMTSLLLELGHREIGFVKGHPEHGASHLRYEGFIAALQDHGVAQSPDRVRQGYFSFRSGVTCAEELLQAPQRPTAVFASNDDMALGVMSVANRMGLAVPGDLSVAGFDDTPTARVVWPQLTTIRQPIAEMSAAAVDMLISGEAKPGGAAPARLLDFELVVRDSTGPARR